MSQINIVIVDYGVGNTHSVSNAISHLGYNKMRISDSEKIIKEADVLILPGVGAFEACVHNLRVRNLDKILHEEVIIKKKPILGICLGMQLLLEGSDEFGLTSGLGLIPGRVEAIPDRTLSGEIQKIPHIGWSAIKPSNEKMEWEHSMLQDSKLGEAAYFVHSFMAVPKYPEHRIADCFYGDHRIAAIIALDKIMGCQFHP